MFLSPVSVALNKSTFEISNNTVAAATIDQAKKPYVKYMRKADIIKVLDSIDNSVNWDRYASNPLSDFLIGKAIAIFTKRTFIGAAVGFLTWAAADLQARQESCWRETAKLLLKGKIKGVKLTVTPNISGGYPVAYRTLTRY